MSSLPKPIESLINLFESLPGIGPKTAERMVFYLLNAPSSLRRSFSQAFDDIDSSVSFCVRCFNVSEDDLCPVCSDPSRDQSQLCVVEEPLDLFAFEKSGYRGLYHCLGGVLSPLNNIGPDEVRIDELLSRVQQGDFKEIILATNPSVEGEATAMFIKNKLSALNRLPSKALAKEGQSSAKITRLGRGLPVGADVEYADAQTLAKSLEGRVEY